MKEEETDQDRLQKLEELSAHQANVIDEMSAELAAMAQNLGEMQRKFDVLTRRFVSLEENLAEIAPDTKPPHW
ncbi:MAG: SlyX family protein [Rhizobiaceae bacterium]